MTFTTRATSSISHRKSLESMNANAMEISKNRPKVSLKRKAQSSIGGERISRQHIVSSENACSDPFSIYMLDDVFLHMMKYFISDSGVIDGKSIRSIMCVNRRWHNLASSKSLWSAAAGPNETYRSYFSMHCRPTQPSYRIREIPIDSRGNLPPVFSLLGFANMGNQITSGNEGTWFMARERATGRFFVINVPPDSKKSNSMLREIHCAHESLGRDFLNDMATGGHSQHRLPFPKGVGMVNGRVLRWYDAGNSTLKEWVSSYGIQKKEILSLSSPNLSEFQQFESSSSRLHPNRLHARSDQWASLVDYLIEIVDVFDLSDNLPYKAMALFDRFLSSTKKFKSKKYQMVACACFLIATKCSMSKRTITENNLAFCADNTFRASHIIAAEEVILRTLDWKLACPGILDFVNQYIAVLELEKDGKEAMMVRYLSDLALQSNLYITYRPSLIAVCVMSLAFHCLGKNDIWPESLEKTSGYLWKDVKKCTLEFSACIDHMQSTMPSLQMIARRYRKSARHRVSYIRIPRLISLPEQVR